MRGKAGGSAALRRYPAYGYLAGVAALALLLPSGLTVPQSGPPTLAEYAPVPGPAEGRSDTAELGLPSTEGIGAGAGRGAGSGPGGDGGDGTTPGGGDGELIRKPGTKRCVGSPPRQTEDPLSPPCVAFFAGDNGGATSKGVTRSTVTAVIESAQGASRTESNPKRLTDCRSPASEDDDTEDMLCKAYQRFFNDRYQTYERTVHLYVAHQTSPAEIDERLSPFVIGGQNVSASIARLGIMNTGYIGQPRERYTSSAPYLNAFRPDLEDQARMVASYVCTRLANRPARYAGDVTLTSRPRKFGLWTGTEAGPYDVAIQQSLERECGIVIGSTEIARGGGDATAAARFKQAGITTVILATARAGEAAITAQATNATYFPEWFVPGDDDSRGSDTNFYGRLATPEQWRNAFGLSVDYRRAAIHEQHWYRAFREGCPSCPEPDGLGGSAAPEIYDVLTLIFTGIQAAGPRLTPARFDQGLHAIPPRASSDPFRPAAYFAPGNHTFIKDAMAIWWDPSGQAPGQPSRGCYRLPQQGRRYRAFEWPAGDDLVKADGPCQGDTFRN
jgi:hypothetical protein